MAFCGVMAFTFLGNGCSRHLRFHLLFSSEVLWENLIWEKREAENVRRKKAALGLVAFLLVDTIGKIQHNMI